MKDNEADLTVFSDKLELDHFSITDVCSKMMNSTTINPSETVTIQLNNFKDDK